MTQDHMLPPEGYDEWFQDEGSNDSRERSLEEKGFQDAAGQSTLLARIDYREELDLSGRNLSYTSGLATTYIALTALNISNNAVTRLDSLPPMLVDLNASHNMIRKICGLDRCHSLRILNLAHNSITAISGVEHCTALTELS
eukprot:2506444-Rhodomonas_salina.1